MIPHKADNQVIEAPDEPSDESLMALVKKGSHQAFAQLVRRHSSRFYAHAWRMCGNMSVAEDIVQDSFLKLWQKPDVYDEDRAKFLTWFYRVVTNAALDVRRARRKMTSADVLEYMAADGPAQDEDLEARRRAASLEAAIQNLPDRQRAALNLCVYEDMSNAQAAEIMKISVKALESLLMRAKAALKDQMLHGQA